MILHDLIREKFPGSFVHVGESGGTLFAQHLIVTPEGRSKGLLGTGYQIAKFICWYADEKQMPIVLGAARISDFDTDERQLEIMYRRLGAVALDNEPWRGMIRFPRPRKNYGRTDNDGAVPVGATTTAHSGDAGDENT